MRNGKIMIGLVTIMLAAMILLGGMLEEPADNMDVSLSFLVQSGQKTEKISCWENPEGEFYVFLPGYARMDDVYFVPAEGTVVIDDVSMRDRASCEFFELNKAYPFSYSSKELDVHSAITFVQSGNVPSLFIDVLSGSMEYIHMDKTNEESAVMRLYGTDGQQQYTGTIASIKGRGNTSWGADKKPYNLTLSENADLLGMGAAQHWILLAEGYNNVNIRNKIVYDFADAAGMPYSPDSEWVDVYLNGEYTGLYLLSERNEIHPERIRIAVDGSFVVSQEYESRLQEQHYPYVITKSGQALRIRHSEISTQELQQRWQTAENAILSETGVDPESGKHWMELIDLDSWARKYLIEEVFGNLDAGSLSQFYYCDGSDPEGKICAGPVWDYDFAMGGESVWLRPYTNYLTMNRAYVNENVHTPWFPALYEQELFLNRVKELYSAVFLPLLQELAASRLDSYFEWIRTAARADGIRWGQNRESFLQEQDYIVSFLKNRIAFLTDLWLKESTYHSVYVDPGRYGLYGHFAVKDGETLPELPSCESLGGIGWYNASTDEPFDVTQPIYEDVQIVVRKEEPRIPKIHYVPAAVLLLALPVLAGLDSLKRRKNGSVRHDAAQIR